MTQTEILRIAREKHWSNSAAKRAFDGTIAMAALIVLSPLILILAALVKICSPGPVFFRQERYGIQGTTFSIFKFRTMYEHAAPHYVRQASENDPRITKIGAFLRKTSLDELPQLLNVIAGDMSLVGPRPHATSHDDHYSRIIPNYLVRQFVRPGLTGLAQSLGYRGETKNVADMRQRIEADLDYVRRNSLMIDLQIMFRTIFTVLDMKNAR